MPEKIREAAGFFLYRLARGGGPEFLLLKNARRGDWGVPKGHRDEEDADLHAAARRELQEETGLTDIAIIEGFECVLEYEARRASGGPKYPKRVTYFLARLGKTRTGSTSVPTPMFPKLSAEHSEFRWVDATEARKLLDFPDLAACVDKAVRRIEENSKHIP